MKDMNYVCLEHIVEGYKYFTINNDEFQENLNEDNTVVHDRGISKVLGYVDTIPDAQMLIYGKVYDA